MILQRSGGSTVTDYKTTFEVLSFERVSLTHITAHCAWFTIGPW